MDKYRLTAVISSRWRLRLGLVDDFSPKGFRFFVVQGPIGIGNPIRIEEAARFNPSTDLYHGDVHPVGPDFLNDK